MHLCKQIGSNSYNLLKRLVETVGVEANKNIKLPNHFIPPIEIDWTMQSTIIWQPRKELLAQPLQQFRLLDQSFRVTLVLLLPQRLPFIKKNDPTWPSNLWAPFVSDEEAGITNQSLNATAITRDIKLSSKSDTSSLSPHTHTESVYTNMLEPSFTVRIFLSYSFT